MRFVLVALVVLSMNCAADEPAAHPAVRKPIPDRLVVLTFDDSAKSHYAIARPLLKEYGFGATFFITEGFDFKTNKKDYMTWEEIRELHEEGFEIGNHTLDHLGIEAYLKYLKLENYQVIALRDLRDYVNSTVEPADHNAIIEFRKLRLKP